MGTRSTAPADIMGAVPTIPVLERIAAARGAELIVTIAPPAACTNPQAEDAPRRRDRWPRQRVQWFVQ